MSDTLHCLRCGGLHHSTQHCPYTDEEIAEQRQARERRYREWKNNQEKKAMTWKPIASAPKDRRIILAVQRPNGKWCADFGRYYPDRGRFTLLAPGAPTHWMPAPDMPEGE